MVVTTIEKKLSFDEFAAEFAKDNQETLVNWLEHGDPVRKAAAKLIMEAL